MEKYCIFCGHLLENGECVNPQCSAKVDGEERSSSVAGRKKPISLEQWRRQRYEADRQKTLRQEGEPEDEEEAKEEETEAEQDPDDGEDQESEEETDGTSEKEMGGAFSPNILERLPCFLADYFRQPGRVVAAAVRRRDTGVAAAMFLTSFLLSAIGTFLFGAVYLEDFFSRWIGGGFVAPLLAYGISLLFSRVFTASRSGQPERGEGENHRDGSFRELFSLVGASAVIPNGILLLSCILGPLDGSLKLFQFFALLLTVAWMVCLLFSLFTVYGGVGSLGALLGIVAFVFLSFLLMRTLWVWYLTGVFRFSLHIPLSVFFAG